MDKLIYRFNNLGGKIANNSKEILGGKGANLAQMAKIGLPVPPGFTISTKVCEYFYKNNKKIPKKVISQTKKEISAIEKITKKKFGDTSNPLLVSVRSGSRVSMPGMMDTILNLGLNDKTVIADIWVDNDENCFPMIQSGSAHNEMLLNKDQTQDKKSAEKGKVLV